MSLAKWLAHRACADHISLAMGIGLIAGLIALIGPGKIASAQSIIAPAAQSATHNGGDAPHVFSEVAWQLQSGFDPVGYTAQWTCGPFQHSVRESLKADCKLQIRILASGGLANWTVVVPSDQTNHVEGDQLADVVAQSTAEGDGEVGLTVTFLDSDFSKLTAGSYSLTVTGTIQAN